MIKKVLILQTAFPGDVILASALLESLHLSNPGIKLDIVIRKGNETLFSKHPFLQKIFTWDKIENKIFNLFRLILKVRKEKYDLLINLQRFTSSGLLTILSAAKETRGFNKNPLSIFFTKRFNHLIGDGRHEIERNHDLIEDLCPGISMPPRLYPDAKAMERVSNFKQESYICVAPGSVWFTKKFPEEKWIEFIRLYSTRFKDEKIYLLGSGSEHELCDRIRLSGNNPNVFNLAGELSFLESAALMKDANMNYVNDSAPLHLASAMNAKTTAIFCSTIPAFGFGPLAIGSRIVETTEKLSCRPCGLHGFKSCPEGHFKCALEIDVHRLIN
jgi:heptosyltransferase-2